MFLFFISVETSMPRIMWRNSLSVRVLLPGADSLHSDGILDRLTALSFYYLRSALLCLWFSSMLFHLLLWMYWTYEALLENVDWIESPVAYIGYERHWTVCWSCFTFAKHLWISESRIRLIMTGCKRLVQTVFCVYFVNVVKLCELGPDYISYDIF